MREIIYSPNFGAGWSSWATNKELKLFMLEYKPFIKFLKDGGSFKGKELKLYFKPNGNDYDFERMKREMSEVLFSFCEECYARFGDIPYLGGLRDAEVMEVSGPIRIEEYDGRETVIEAFEEEYY